MLLLLEWIGCGAGLIGAFKLASGVAPSRTAWVAVAAANVAIIGLAMGIDRHGLLLQQLGFMATSCIGLYRTRGGTAGPAAVEAG